MSERRCNIPQNMRDYRFCTLLRIFCRLTYSGQSAARRRIENKIQAQFVDRIVRPIDRTRSQRGAWSARDDHDKSPGTQDAR